MATEVNQTTQANDAPEGQGVGLGALPADIRAVQESKAYWDDREPDHAAANAKVKAYYQNAAQKAAPAEEEGRAPAPASEYDSFKPDLPESDRGELVALAQESGIPAADLQEIVGEFFKNTSADRFKPVDAETAMVVLTKAWGGETEINLGVVRDFVEQRPALAEFLETTRLGDSPAVAQALYKLATRYAAEGDEVEKLMRSESYRDSRHPEHKATFERVTRMFAKRYAGQQVPE